MSTHQSPRLITRSYSVALGSKQRAIDSYPNAGGRRMEKVMDICSRRLLLVVILLMVGSWQPSLAAASSATASKQVLLHALPGIAFLPPIGTIEARGDDFNPDVDFDIEIFGLENGQAVGSPVGPSFSTQVNDEFEISSIAQQYRANWKTSDSGQPYDRHLRVELRLPNAKASVPVCNGGVSMNSGCIAYFDVMLRTNLGTAKKTPAIEGVMNLVHGQTLPLKIYIDQSFLDPTPTSQLPGAPGDLATEAIPDLPFAFLEDGYSDDHPELQGVMISFNMLFLIFELDTTVGEANAILAEIGAEIIGGVPGSAADEVEGVLFLHLPITTQAEMIATLELLHANPKVKIAVQDSQLEPQVISKPNGGTPAGWIWESMPADDNWGMELIRVPQMWNFNGAIKKQMTSTITGIFDAGFSSGHPDIRYLQNLTSVKDDHGTHVAGIVGAIFNNGVGVDGVNPFSGLVVEEFGTGSGFGIFNFLDARTDMQVINISLGVKWMEMTPPINPNTSMPAQRMLRDEGIVFSQIQFIRTYLLGKSLPFLVVAAGNDNVDARWSSPFTYAALVLGADNIMVVESVDLVVGSSTSKSSFSNRKNPSDLDAAISAPGRFIMSTISSTPFYDFLSGTSMAAPHVTGLVSYLLSLEPTLTHAEILRLLLDNDVVTGGGASNRIDAYASVMDIDRIRGNTNILMKLVDIDDGTLDGNQRVLCDTCGDFEADDVDGDNGVGDGNVDMADFRTWRDWLLQIENSADLKLDGSAGHIKKDINGNKTLAIPVETPAKENIYPKGDFNGDGKLDRSSLNRVSGSINTQVTDLEVLEALFNDPHYQIGQLQGLIESADLEIDAANCFSDEDVVEVKSMLFESGSESILEERVHTIDEPRHIYTAVVNSSGYSAKVEALDGGGKVVGIAQKDFPFELGSDAFYTPECGSIVVDPEVLELHLNVKERSIETVKLVSTDLKANFEITGSVDYVVVSPTEGTVGKNAEVSLELTVDCPEEAGDYPINVPLEFSDDSGNAVSDAVPESIDIELSCVTGGVVATPDPVKLAALVDQDVSFNLHLQNFGTALNYELFAHTFVSITGDALGVLEDEGQASVLFSASCPAQAGIYTSNIDLSFTDDSGNAVTENVPSSVAVELICQAVSLRVDSEVYKTLAKTPTFPDGQGGVFYTIQYFSPSPLDTVGDTALIRDVEILPPPNSSSNTSTVIPLLEIPLELSLSKSFPDTQFEYFCDSEIVNWSANGTASALFLSNYEDDKIVFEGTFANMGSISHLIPFECDNGIGGGYQIGSSARIEFTLLQGAFVNANWSCGGEFHVQPGGGGGISLRHVSRSLLVFTAENEDCHFDGYLLPGEYRFAGAVWIAGYRGDEVDLQTSRDVMGSYRIEFSRTAP